MFRFLTVIFLLLTGSSLFCQNLETVIKFEDVLLKQLDAVRSTNDRAEQIPLNKKFQETLRKALLYDEAFTYDFSELSKVIGIITSPDGAFRIFNWNIEYGDYEQQKYHCFIMKKNAKSGEFETIELWDKTEASGYRAETNQLTQKKWIGALYYTIIPVKKGVQTVYTLLGWDGNDMISNKKIIETMQFYRGNQIKFGVPILKYEDDKGKSTTKRRVIFEYTKESSMSLKYKETKKKRMIIFDHLAPINPAIDIPSYQATDLSFDAFVWEGNKWKYVKDVDARTGKKFKSKYNAPKEANPSNP